MGKISKDKFKEKVIDTGGVIVTIASKLGVVRQTLYTWLKKNPDMEELRLAEEEAILDMAEESLFSQVKAKDFSATKYLLSTKGKRRGYQENQEIKHTGDGFKLIIEK